MNNRQRVVTSVWAVAVAAACVFVPWKFTGGASGDLVLGPRAEGYSWLWSPIKGQTTVDFGRLALELIALSMVAGIVYVFLGVRGNRTERSDV